MRKEDEREIANDGNMAHPDIVIGGLCSVAGHNAEDKGWRDVPTTVGEQLALLHCEVSEATEEARRRSDLTAIFERLPSVDAPADEEPKPVGFPIELADVVIKTCEIANHYNVDLVSAIRRKLAYNATRPYRHGDKIF